MVEREPIIMICGPGASSLTTEMIEKLYEMGTGNILLELEATPLEKALSAYDQLSSQIYDPNVLTEQEKFFKMKEQKQFRKMCKRGK